MMQILPLIVLLCIRIGGSHSKHLRGNALNDDSPSTRIIGGLDVQDPHRYPYFAMVSGFGGLCGGALIAPDIVLSAAHCRNTATLTGGVDIGRFRNTDSGTMDGIERQFAASETRFIQEKIFHPLYPNPNNYYSHDIMLLKLTEASTKPPVKLRKTPILETSNNNTRLTTIGFGGSNVFSDTLQETSLNYMDNDQCQEEHGLDVWISDDMMCATESGTSTCNGDGGGPLFLKGLTPEEDELVGTVST